MRKFDITKAQLLDHTMWVPTGKSPGNTPQAKLQTAQLLMQMAANPATGIDAHELATVVIQNGALANATNIQIPKEQMQANAAMAQQQQIQSAGSGPLPDQAMAGSPGGPVAPQPIPNGVGGGAPTPQSGGPAPIPEPRIPRAGENPVA